MSYRAVKDVWFDQCQRCGGSYIDFSKLGYLLGPQADPRNWPKEALVTPPWQSRLYCPAGHGPMWAHLLGADEKRVEIDSCPHCYSVWLDNRESAALQEIAAEAKAMNARPGAGGGTAGVVALYLLQLATTLPIEVHNPVKRRPILIWSIVAANLAVFALEVSQAMRGHGEAFISTWGLVPNVFFSGKNPWTILTHAFMHGGIAHILGNLYFLYIFGDNVEDRLGRGRFAVLYLASAVLAGLAHAAPNHASSQPMVGASGAIAGLMGAYFVLFPRVKVWVVFFFAQFKVRAVYYLLVWIGLQFLIMLDKKSNVAWLAHVGGFIAGAGLAYLLKPKVERVEEPPAAAPF